MTSFCLVAGEVMVVFQESFFFQCTGCAGSSLLPEFLLYVSQSRGYFLVSAHWLLIVVASLVAEHML